MKILKLCLVGFIAVLLGACVRIEKIQPLSEEESEQVFSYYYQQQDPQRLMQALAAFEDIYKPHMEAPITGFLSALALQRPQDWQIVKHMFFTESSELNRIWASVEQRKEIMEEMLSKKNVIVVSPEDLDFLWGAFSATGDTRFVEIIARTAKFPLTNPLVKAAAEWSMSSQREQHPLVDKALQKDIEIEKDDVFYFNIFPNEAIASYL